ncbi:MAG: hypothetical protein Q9181_005207 [Wetmoreana brouardii]
MATIKAIEGRSVHQIQSGQVIVDLCSVAKELVENSLDAGATSIALKHYTSKLSTYDDLSSLQTFGFRGEALSSLCALSNFHVVTARADEAPKGTRLDFETSGKLKATSVVASQKGTTVAVEALFANLPVRRRELEKSIKREYGKVLGLLQAYACISTSVKLSVSNVMAKGKKVVVFATKSNTTTRENIANVFGAKTLPALVSMDLEPRLMLLRNTQVRVLGHVSRPVFGEGRQTPDRQMFFVNARPCTLPQFAKVFNEVYKSYNLSQSPFVFANIVIDTNAYDVNVSPDKRTILLHDQTALLESLRASLVELFERQDQTVPQTQPQRPQSKLPAFKQLTVQRQDSNHRDSGTEITDDRPADDPQKLEHQGKNDDLSDISDKLPKRTTSLIEKFAGRDVRERSLSNGGAAKRTSAPSEKNQKLIPRLEYSNHHSSGDEDDIAVAAAIDAADESQKDPLDPVTDFNKRIAEQHNTRNRFGAQPPEVSPGIERTEDEQDVPSVKSTPGKPASGIVQNAFDRMRPRRVSPQIATITIGDKTTTTVLGSSPSRPGPGSQTSSSSPKLGEPAEETVDRRFGSSLQAFAAPASQVRQTRPSSNISSIRLEAPTAAHLASQSSITYEVPTEDESGSEVSNGEYGGARKEMISGEEAGNEVSSAEGSDGGYLDDEDRKAKQEAKVAKLIRQAEEKLAAPIQDNLTRAGKILQGSRGLKDSTTQLVQTLHTSVSRIEDQLRSFEQDLQKSLEKSKGSSQPNHIDEEAAEQKLSLTISKSDFSRMNIIGQFNLGFILAIRPSTSTDQDDELFIVDQHASDEKYNFERLQASTTLQSQNLVRPKILNLTAIEEEIVVENNAVLTANGFVVEVDQSGDVPVGRRCKLLSLPMSREVTFDLTDLEELIALLGDSPPASTSASTQNMDIPRPSKVRKLFATRACRSSIMIGKTLKKRQMERLVRNMGTIEKPWNCPHGRPTMRHVLGLGGWEGWREWESDGGLERMDKAENPRGVVDWKEWLAGRKWEGGDKVEGVDEGSGEDVGDGGYEGSQDRDDSATHDEETGTGDGQDMDMGDNGQDGLKDDNEDERRGTNDSDEFEEDGGSDKDEETGGTSNLGSLSQRFLFS